MTRRLRGWILRLLALGAVVFVLAGQVRWQDELTLATGEVLAGGIEETEAGDFRVLSADAHASAVARTVPRADVGLRGEGDRAVPAVAWGIRTLAGRLSRDVTPALLVLFLLALLIVFTGWRWYLLLRAADLVLAFPRALRLTWIGAFFNQAVPGSTGGDVVKAWYAAVATGRGARSVLSVFVDRVGGLLGLALVAGLALLLAPPGTEYGPARIVALCVLVGGIVAGALALSPRLRAMLGLTRLFRRLPFQTLLAEVAGAARLYGSRKGVLLFAVLVGAANHAVAAFCVWLLAGVLGIEGITLGAALALVPVANLMSAIPLVPGGWGVGELAFAWLFGQLGVPATEAVGLSVIYRLGLLVVSLPGGPLWIFWAGRPSRESIERRVEEATHAVESMEGAGGDEARASEAEAE
ncbi:MAG: lysylphosphatidylglycerol synthase transmembrane domain-containing protein [Planctomycetota bacterium]